LSRTRIGGGKVGGDLIGDPTINRLGLRRGKLKVPDEVFDFLIDQLRVADDGKPRVFFVLHHDPDAFALNFLQSGRDERTGR